jgi:hypothetical protein
MSINFNAWLPTDAYPANIDRTAEALRRIAKMRAIYAATLRDLCIIQTRGADTGDYGYGSPSYTDGSAIACLFVPTPAEESEGAQALTIDGEIRLPRSTTISNLDRIKVTTLYNSTTGLPQVYEIVQGPIRTHIGYTMKVKLVTDGSGT